MILILIIIIALTILFFYNLEETFATPTCASNYTKTTFNKKLSCVNCAKFGGTLGTTIQTSNGYYNNDSNAKSKMKLYTDVSNYPICNQTCPDPSTISNLKDIGPLTYNQSKSILHFCSTSSFLCPLGFSKSGNSCVINSTQACPTGYTYNSSTKVCLPAQCPIGYKLSGSYCASICDGGFNYINNTCQPVCPKNTIMAKDSSGNYYCEYLLPPNTDDYELAYIGGDMRLRSKCTKDQMLVIKNGVKSCVPLACPAYKGTPTTLIKNEYDKYFCYFNTCAADENLTSARKCVKKCKLNYNFIKGDNTYSCKPVCPKNFSTVIDPANANYYKCIPTCNRTNVSNLKLLNDNTCAIDTSTPICPNKYIYNPVSNICTTTTDFSLTKTPPTFAENPL